MIINMHRITYNLYPVEQSNLKISTSTKSNYNYTHSLEYEYSALKQCFHFSMEKKLAFDETRLKTYFIVSSRNMLRSISCSNAVDNKGHS